MPKSTKTTTTEPPMTREQIEALVVAVVKRELSGLVENFEARVMDKHKGTGTRVVKKTVSVPADLWALFRRECLGSASSHVTAAIRLYLSMRQTEQE